MPIYKIGEVVRDLCHDCEVKILEIEPKLNGDGVGYLCEDEDGAEVWLRETDIGF